MIIAIAGKGGTGKTFLAASLARMYAGHMAGGANTNEGYIPSPGRAYDEPEKHNRQVYAIDADPCGGLGAALGLSRDEIESVKPIADMREFFEPGKDDGALYLSAPDVNSVGGQYNAMIDGVNFLRMACIKQAGAGCYCQEFGFLQAMINSMLLGDEDILILDMGAGIEHLTRGAIKGTDLLLIVSEATRACIETSRTIRALGAGLGVKRIYIVANKIRNEKEEILIRASFHRGELIGLVRASEIVAEQSIGIGAKHNPPPFMPLPDIEELYQNLLSINHNK